MTAKRALLIWGVLTLLVISSLLSIWLWRGAAGFEIAIQRGPFTNLPVALASVAATWLLGGIFLHLLSSKQIDSKNALTWAGFFLVALVYLNLMRERVEYGDVEYYIAAAFKLAVEGVLPIDYYYPPLWATLLAWLAPLGEDGAFITIWFFNLLGLFAFYFLLSKTLELYGFSANLAALVTTVFMLANAPILRTMVYMQINLHVLNMVLLGLLLYQRYPALSAMTTAIAVHLKASPAVLVLAFLLEWNWRWLVWAGLSFLVVGALPIVFYGFQPYLDFIRNTALVAAGHGLNFRENSFEGLLMAFSAVLSLPDAFVEIGTNIARAVLFVAAILVMRRNIQRETFFTGAEGARLFNTMPSLLILMTLASPIVWVHHGIFVGLSFLLLLKKLDSPASWTLFGFAYFFEFLLPTFDFFPWSYGRLVAPLIILWLMWKLSDKSSELFPKANCWAESLLMEKTH